MIDHVKAALIGILLQRRPMKAKTLASELSMRLGDDVSRTEVSQLLYGPLRALVEQDRSSFAWRLRATW